MLPKSQNCIISLDLLALPGYSLYVNFDPDSYTPVTSHMHGVRIFVSEKLKAHQVFFDSTEFDQVWAKIQLRGSDSLLVGCQYHSPTGHLGTSISSLCNITILTLICGDFNFKAVA